MLALIFTLILGLVFFLGGEWTRVRAPTEARRQLGAEFADVGQGLLLLIGIILLVLVATSAVT